MHLEGLASPEGPTSLQRLGKGTVAAASSRSVAGVQPQKARSWNPGQTPNSPIPTQAGVFLTLSLTQQGLVEQPPRSPNLCPTQKSGGLSGQEWLSG